MPSFHPTPPPIATGPTYEALIERGLASELRAEVKLAFPLSGAVFTLAAPLSESLREG